MRGFAILRDTGESAQPAMTGHFAQFFFAGRSFGVLREGAAGEGVLSYHRMADPST
jgi:hypothetical protein